MAKVTLKDLSHSYLKTQSSDADWAIRGVNIDWNDGGAYALLGPSGCGKTTLLNIICLLYTSPSPRDRQKSRMPSSA